jgi:anti-sigma factor RsiW
MNCRRFQRDIFEYLEGSLSESTRSAAQRHLEHCEVCLHSAQELDRTSRFLMNGFRNESEFLALTADVKMRIKDSVGETPTEAVGTTAIPGLFARSWIWLGPGIAIIALAIFVFWRSQVRPAPSMTQRAMESPATISLRISYCEPTYTFRADGNFVIDSVNCQPCVLDESLQVPHSQAVQEKERNSEL